MDEKMRILKMIEDGTITAEEAAKLLDSLGTEHPIAHSPSFSENYDNEMLYILVDSKTGGDKIDIKFPIGAIKKILKITGKLPIPEEKLHGLDLKAVMDVVSECLDSQLRGDLVDISGSDGTTVKIFVK